MEKSFCKYSWGISEKNPVKSKYIFGDAESISNWSKIENYHISDFHHGCFSSLKHLLQVVSQTQSLKTCFQMNVNGI